MVSIDNSRSGLSRRQFLRLAALLGLSPWQPALAQHRGTLVNDVHSALNPTWVSRILKVDSVSAATDAILLAKKSQSSLSICGARHAAGGQQFLTDALLLDTTFLKQIIKLDQEAGLVTVQSGICWLDLQNALANMQLKAGRPWGINQKQTGLNTLTIGGTLAANAHGQGLVLKPFVDDIDSFRLIDANGDLINCSRRDHSDLFALVVGGYGLFGLVPEVTIKLVPRQKVRRLVRMIPVRELQACVNDSIGKGYRYGHCQLNIDESSDGYLAEGIFATYEPVPLDTPIKGTELTTTTQGWSDLVALVHTNKPGAYKSYVDFYKGTDGFINWADIWQNSDYVVGYHRHIDQLSASKNLATEVLSEFFVPLAKLEVFLSDARKYFLAHGQNIIFSTIRFIEQDDVTLLPWARQRYACVIFNFHTVHSEKGIEQTMSAWSHLIDRANELNGTFYLTYQHVADKKQILASYPNFDKFLQLKLQHDPHELFQSDWYRWHKKLFA